MYFVDIFFFCAVAVYVDFGQVIDASFLFLCIASILNDKFDQNLGTTIFFFFFFFFFFFLGGGGGGGGEGGVVGVG